MRKSIIIIFAIGILVGGCDLLGNQKPQQSLPLNQAYNTVADLHQELIGAYNDLQYDATNNRPVGGADWSVFGEIIADNTSFQGSYTTLQDLAQHKMDPNNGSVNAVWYGSYRIINDVNVILDKLSSITDGNQAELDNIKGQSLFIRGMVYYYLVNFYAKPWVGAPGDANSQLGVPLVTKPVTSSADFTDPGRATVSEVYTQLKKDLSDAASLLPDKTADGQGNKYASMAMLLRVAMQQHDYATAATLSKQIMDSGQYALNSDVQTFFTQEFSPESIFEISNTVQDNIGVNISLTALYNPKERGDIRISDNYVQALENIVPQSQKDAMA
ncbi:MAG TPA: RagB/SusD family nutrient uptake outer membrane protein, partial [Balneolales bacterium]|nr:RagB/SusD family nutrient uptake outer membrane protein [Balneolales bacterium]